MGKREYEAWAVPTLHGDFAENLLLTQHSSDTDSVIFRRN